jgi:hypothetical protein
MLVLDLRQIFGGIGFQRFEEDAVFGDLALGLAVGGTADAKADRQRGAVAGQADDADVVAEILAAELGADAEALGQLVDFLFHLQIAEGMAAFRTLGGQFVEIVRGGKLDRLQVHLGRGAADDDGEMVGGTGCRAERQDFVFQEGYHALMRQQRRRALVEIGLVGRAAALGDEQEVVGVGAFLVDIDLGGQIVLGVLSSNIEIGASCE